MELLCLGSSSKGNSYLLSNGQEAVALEAGIPFKEVKKATGWNIGGVRGCLVSHKHADHSGRAHEFARAGIPVLGPGDIFSIPHNKNMPVQPGKGYSLGRFKVVPFEVPHDVTTFGYVITHPDSGRILFLTDTYMMEHKVKDVDHLLIECNYSHEILEKNIDEGKVHPAERERLLYTHMELDTTILTAGMIPDLKTIVLLHLSDRNSDEKLFTERVIAATGVKTVAADKGVKVKLNKKPF